MFLDINNVVSVFCCSFQSVSVMMLSNVKQQKVRNSAARGLNISSSSYINMVMLPLRNSKHDHHLAFENTRSNQFYVAEFGRGIGALAKDMRFKTNIKRAWQ